MAFFRKNRKAELIGSAPGSLYNVKNPDYAGGAKGDGITDDTAAIQATLDAAYAAGGGVVYAPQGTYMIKGDGTASHGGVRVKANVHFMGDGIGATTLKLMSTQAGDITGIVRVPSGEKHDNVTISDMTIQGTGEGSLTYKIDGFFCGVAPSHMLKVTVSGTTATGVSYDDKGLAPRSHGLGDTDDVLTIYIKHDGRPGIDPDPDIDSLTGDVEITIVNSTTFTFTVPSGTANDNGTKSYTWHYDDDYENSHQRNIVLERVEIRDCYRYGFDPHEGTDGLIFRDCIGRDNGIGAGGDNFTLDCIINGLVENCDSWGGGRNGITTPTGSHNVKFVNCRSFDNAQYGFASQRGSNTSPRNRNITFENCESYGNREGFRINMSIGDKIIGCFAHDNRRNGILLEGASDMLVKGNHCYNNSQETNDKYQDILLKQYSFSGDGLIYPCKNNIIEGNQCRAEKAVKVRYSINESAGDSCDFNYILNNNVSGAVRTGSDGGVIFTGSNTEYKPPLTSTRVVNVTESSKVLGNADRGTIQAFNKTTTQSAVIPSDITETLPVDKTIIEFERLGTGQVNIKAQTGVTLNTTLELGSNESLLRLPTRFNRGTARKIGANLWFVKGDFAAPGAVTGAVIAVGAGQSNMANQFTDAGGAGAAEFQDTIDAVIIETNDFINGAEGGSYLVKTTADTQEPPTTEYWIDDSDSDPANWVAGPELDDFYQAIIDAAWVNADVTHVIWAQGESDASRINTHVITKQYYKDALAWLFDHFRDNLPNLEHIVIQPLNRRSPGSSQPAYQSVREVQLETAAAFADVVMSAEVYDLALADDVHIDDYVPVGLRNANRILRLRGETVTNATGPFVSAMNVSGDGTQVIMDVTHDGGTTLNSYVATPIDVTAQSGDNFFRFLNLAGVEITPDIIEVTDTDEVTATSAEPNVDEIKVYGGYQSMSNLDVTNALITDGALYLQTFVQTAAESLLISESGKTEAVSFTGTTESTLNAALASTFSLARGFVAYGGCQIDNGSHALRDTLFSLNFSSSANARATRVYSSPSNPGPTIYVAGHAVQIPEGLRDGVFRIGILTMVTSETTVSVTLTGDDVVDPDRSFVFMPSGLDYNASGIGSLVYLSMSGQTITATRIGNSSTLHVPYIVWQLPETAFFSMEEVTASIATGATSGSVTLATPVTDTSETVCFPMGAWWSKLSDPATTDFSVWNETHPLGYLLDNDTFVAERNSASADHTSYVKAMIVNFRPGRVTVQRGQTAITGSLSTPASPTTVDPVALDASWIQLLGRKCSGTGGSEYQVNATVEQTDVDEVTVTRSNQGGVGTTLTVSWELINF